jgi:hypothetical protein
MKANLANILKERNISFFKLQKTMGNAPTSPHLKMWADGKQDIYLSTLRKVVNAINKLTEDKVTINDII